MEPCVVYNNKTRVKILIIGPYIHARFVLNLKLLAIRPYIHARFVLNLKILAIRPYTQTFCAKPKNTGYQALYSHVLC